MCLSVAFIAILVTVLVKVDFKPKSDDALQTSSLVVTNGKSLYTDINGDVTLTFNGKEWIQNSSSVISS